MRYFVPMSAPRRMFRLRSLFGQFSRALLASVLLGVCLLARSASAQEILPHRPLLPGFGSLCDGGPLACTRIDEFAFNARADAILLTSTDQRGPGFVTPYGFSIGLFERLEGGVYTHTEVWGQEPAPGGPSRRWQQGPMRFLAKGLLWPWRKDPHQRFAALLDFEYEARLPHFDGPNQLGLLTDLGVLRGVVNWPIGLAEVGLSAGALFDGQGRYGTAELGGRVALHLPFLPDTKVFIEGVARGFASRIGTDEPLPGALDPARPIRSGGALGLGIVTRQSRAVDFAMVMHAGFGDVAPFFLTLRFADIAWGKGYPRPKSLVAEAVQEFATWVREQIASIDPMFSEHCQMFDDPKPGRPAESMDLTGHQTPDGQHCLWNGLWLDKNAHYWKNQRGTLLCHDKDRNHCFAERASPSEPWVPLENPARRAFLRGDCIFEDADSKHLLSVFGQRSPDGTSCTDGINTVPVGQYTSYEPALEQIDLGPQGPHRRGLLAGYHKPTTLQYWHTRLGRGVEAGQRENRQKEAEQKEAAAAADAALEGAWKEAEQMTLARLRNGVEAAEEEARAEIGHAAADPKGTFKRALDRFGKGLASAAQTTQRGTTAAVQGVKQGARDAADWTRKPLVEQVGDVFEVGGKFGATAHRTLTTDVTMAVATGGATKLLGGMVKGAQTLEKIEHAGEAVADSKKLGKLATKAEKTFAEHKDGAAPLKRAAVETNKRAAQVQTEATIEVKIPSSRYPESAGHIQDAQRAGHPTELTIDRGRASNRRAESLANHKKTAGMDRDEYPPAMFQEGGTGASVRPISPGDNRGAGACIGAQCRGLPNGSKVTIKVTQ
jgi:hypothetical protein